MEFINYMYTEQIVYLPKRNSNIENVQWYLFLNDNYSSTMLMSNIVGQHNPDLLLSLEKWII
jgi:hypothetical protein